MNTTWLSESEFITYLSGNDLEQLLQILTADNYRVFELEIVKCVEDLFREVIVRVPLDPPLSGGVNWDAFSDSIFGGIVLQPEKKVAIVWRDADLMAKKDPEEFSIANDIFATVAQDISNPSYVAGPENVKHLRTFLLGDSHYFRSAGIKVTEIND